MSVNSPYPGQIANPDNLPDKEAFVDLITAEDYNLRTAYIRDITATLGVNPQGTCENLTARLNACHDANGLIQFPGNVRTVGKTNAQFNTIQAAIDSITDASSIKEYVVLIYPGEYEEQITPKPYVSLHGIHSIPVPLSNINSRPVTIRNLNDYVFLFTSPFDLHLYNIYVECSNTPIFNHNFADNSKATINATDCSFYTQNQNVPLLGNKYGLNFRFMRCRVSAKYTTNNIYAYNSELTYGCSLKASYSDITGGLNIIAGEDSGYELSLYNSKLSGSNNFTVYTGSIYLVNSYLTINNANIINLNCQYEVSIEFHNSYLKTTYGYTALHIVNSTEDMSGAIIKCHSAYNLEAGLDNYFSLQHNTVGQVHVPNYMLI